MLRVQTIYAAGFEPAYKPRRLKQRLPKTSIGKIDHVDKR